MRREAGWFGEEEPELVYIAGRLKDATRLEELLTAAGIDYGVEADEFEGGFIFRRTRTGAFFYVRTGNAAEARRVMADHGYRPAEGAG